jgi:hypothetical protein
MPPAVNVGHGISTQLQTERRKKLPQILYLQPLSLTSSLGQATLRQSSCWSPHLFDAGAAAGCRRKLSFTTAWK